MTEITFGESGGSSGSSSGGSSNFDVTELLDQVEEAKERVMNDPELRQFLGIELDAEAVSSTVEEDPHEVNKGQMDESEKPTKDEVDAQFLEQLLGGLVDEGYGNKSIQEVHTFVANNPTFVNNLIEEQA